MNVFEERMSAMHQELAETAELIKKIANQYGMMSTFDYDVLEQQINKGRHLASKMQGMREAQSIISFEAKGGTKP